MHIRKYFSAIIIGAILFSPAGNTLAAQSTKTTPKAVSQKKKVTKKTTPKTKLSTKKTIPKATQVKKPATTSSKKITPPPVSQAKKPTESVSKGTTTPPTEIKQQASTLPLGSYRCWSYNVSGAAGGGAGDLCRLSPPLVLKADYAYSISSEKGTYYIKDGKLYLSESKLRGVGTILGTNQIRFEYDYNQFHHVITYLRESTSPSQPQSGTGQPAEVAVEVILEYPQKDSALNSIVTLELVPEGQDIKTATYKPTAIAVWDGSTHVTGSFHKATNMPRTGQKYTVYANTGFGATAVGTLDLTKTQTDTKAVITVNAASTKPQEAKQSEVEQSTAPEIVVEVVLEYAEKDSSLGGITTMVLVPEGEEIGIASYKPTALAIWDGSTNVSGSFHKATNQVRSGKRYDVYIETGFTSTKVGILDLITVKEGPYKKIIPIAPTPSQTSTPTQPQTQSGASTSQTSSAPAQQQSSPTTPSSGTPCNPSIPTYSQPGCIPQ